MGLRQKIRHNLGYLTFVSALAGASLYFTVSVQAIRGDRANARITQSIASGTEVTVVDVIDGDEIVVRASGGANFVVRMLGIKSFDPSANDPSIVVFGRAARIYLEGSLRSRPATLEFDEFKKDTRGRLLAYVHNPDGEDAGQVLLARGLVMVYLEYPFGREPSYRLTQAEAREARRGLWGAPRAAERAQSLIEAWEARREP